MQCIIHKSFLTGNVSAPPSKSYMQRTLAASLICPGKTILQNTCSSADSIVAKNIIEKFGASVSVLTNDSLEIISEGFPEKFENRTRNIQIHFGESGLATRMFVPIAALLDHPIDCTGDESLQKRPMDFLEKIFPSINVKIHSQTGKLPFTFQGPLIPKNIEIDCSIGSQFLTGLLMAYSAVNATGVTITVKNLNSAGYIDLTLDVMKKFDMHLPVYSDFSSFYYNGKSEKKLNKKRVYTIEGDWSGGAFLMVAGAIAGNINISGLDIQSSQPDKTVVDVLKSCGATIKFRDGTFHLSKSPLKAFHFDATGCPDLFPPLAALASCCEGITSIKGVHRLEHKESNRAEAIQQELKKMGIPISIENDEMIITGGNTINPSIIQTHNDHRIAMMCAIVALLADGETLIQDAEVVNKSYPNFFRDLQTLGASISII